MTDIEFSQGTKSSVSITDDVIEQINYRFGEGENYKIMGAMITREEWEAVKALLQRERQAVTVPDDEADRLANVVRIGLEKLQDPIKYLEKALHEHAMLSAAPPERLHFVPASKEPDTVKHAECLWREIDSEDGWIPHTGDECPVPPDTIVHVKFENGETDECNMKANFWIWKHHGYPYDIIAYKVIK